VLCAALIYAQAVCCRRGKLLVGKGINHLSWGLRGACTAGLDGDCVVYILLGYSSDVNLSCN
jgi:hypothetical protein